MTQSRSAIAATAALLVVTMTATSCGSPTDPEPVTTYFTFNSEPGDWVGSGKRGGVTLADGPWFARYFGGSDSPRRFEVGVPGWSMVFAAPEGQIIGPGVFEDAQRSPVEPYPVLDVSTNRGCNVTSGRFEIGFVALGENGDLDKLRVTFSQYCEGSSAALHGEVSVVANPWR